MIVIPMAGLSSRFASAGYKLPKYMLPLWGSYVFDQSVSSFSALFGSETFIFVVRDGASEREFVEQRVAALGIADASVVQLEYATSGQAETVFLGLGQLARSESEPLTIFNIDTFRPGYRHSDLYGRTPNLLEVFRGSGPNWSYVKPDTRVFGKVVATAEKIQISDLCCTGLYRFESPAEFSFAFEQRKQDVESDSSETYVAPLYNYLLRNGKNVHYNIIESEDVLFCGIPVEYEFLIESRELG